MTSLSTEGLGPTQQNLETNQTASNGSLNNGRKVTCGSKWTPLFIVLTILGIGGCGVAIMGSLGLFGSLAHINTIVAIAASGGGGIIFLISGIVGVVKSCRRPDAQISTNRKEGAETVGENEKPDPSQGLTIGKPEWEKYFGKLGDVPQKPAVKWDAACPFFPGKTLRETHMLVLIPKTVGGGPLTLKRLGELFAKLNHERAVGWDPDISSWSKIEAQNIDVPIAESHWVLMTSQVIPDSWKLSYPKMKECVENAGDGYRLPLALEASVCIFMANVLLGSQFYKHALYRTGPYGSSIEAEGTYTFCQESINGGDPQFVPYGWHVYVGSFSEQGLFISYGGGTASSGSSAFGVAAVRAL